MKKRRKDSRSARREFIGEMFFFLFISAFYMVKALVRNKLTYSEKNKRPCVWLTILSSI